DDVMAVRRMELCELGKVYEDNSTRNIIDEAKNKHGIKAFEVKPISCENLNRLSFYSRINYWEVDEYKEDDEMDNSEEQSNKMSEEGYDLRDEGHE
ncbi:11501_t:CDS:2, partial [Gigaspora margarita]